MQIQVKCGCDDGSCREWAVVELQGVVEPQASVGARLPGLEIGRLCRPSSSPEGCYTFTVSYHELMGKRVALKKPLLVLKRRPSAAAPSGVELDVVGVIRHKILFKDRPKALISKPQPQTKDKNDTKSDCERK